MTSSFDEDTLRALVRETIARIDAGSRGHEPHHHEPPALVPARFLSHASHYQYTLPPSGGPCYIEPGVTCSHCGYCQSHGH